MAKLMGLFSLLYPLLLSAFLLHCHCNDAERKVHIVYMGEKPQGEFSAASTHHSMLKNALIGSGLSAKESLVYSYGKSFNGFAARLSDEEVGKLSEMEGVVSVIPNHIFKIHTTRSWDFMGFSKGKLSGALQGDVVIGLLDTGVWPESESFSDDGMGSAPFKWKGICQGEGNFTCNNKIIGARYYNSLDLYDVTDFKSPRDSEGHGTHTASTAAGRVVKGASYLGLAEGNARGAVPFARIAVYKVCWSFGCATADILAAFDDAIADGVDILSVSLGAPFAFPYLHDPVAIGSYHAMKHGILTSNSAGNSGPSPYTASNVAPWTLTVAASTIDRKFLATAVLGNGKSITGLSINNFMMNGTYPLIWGGDAANYSAGADPNIAKFCIDGALNSYIAAGKIVFCEAIWDGSGVLLANGVGTIMADAEYSNDFAFSYPLPATVINVADGQQVLNYIRSSENPTATILVSEARTNDIMAPSVVSFSSRGPNMISPDILKPDLTAPGVDILAAWSPVSPPSIYFDDKRSVNFNIISGTSMSCPHASGAAAYVKAAHPDWSPAAVKSALMTTAIRVDSRKHRDLEFAYGSGHINPIVATDPGLIYDASEADYINFLCKQGYNSSTLRFITGDNSSVCNNVEPGRGWDLNYPSFSLAIEDGQPIYGVFTRTVTNVGLPNSTYMLTIYLPSTISITVEPTTLSFSATGEKKTFTVTVSGPKIAQQPIMSAAIMWTSGSYEVRSPLVIYNILAGATYSPPDSLQGKSFKFDGSSVYHKNGILGRNLD
ncbi:Subtilisin-like protease [Euphorbia peplus]|nr:Subtilisin-like protease [Euphorbia peplus]